MGLDETILFYLLVGLAVAVAVWIAGAERPLPRFFRALSAVPFWPLYLPVLLAPKNADRPEVAAQLHPGDELMQQIAEVERELEAAFASLDGWAEDALAHERGRLAELHSAWNAQAARIREMDHVLADAHVAGQLGEERDRPAESMHRSENARRENLVRLRQLRDRAHTDLTGTLARARELVSLIHLARFTGAPALRAEQLVQQIAASLKGLSEVTAWAEPLTATDAGTASLERPTSN